MRLENKKNVLVVVNNAAAQPLRYGKFKDSAAPIAIAHGNDLPIFRYADALLTYAEAAKMANGAPTALALERLNMVKRRGYGVSPASPNATIDFTLAGQSMAAFRELVLTERAYEFMSKAKRWFDIKRLGVNRVKEIIKVSKNVDVKDAHLFWPLPVQEIDNNPDINPKDQNPGY